MKRISQQININSTLVEKKISKIYLDIDYDKIMKIIDKKMNKEDAFSKFDSIENKVSKLEKIVKSDTAKLLSVEVRLINMYNCIVFLW